MPLIWNIGCFLNFYNTWILLIFSEISIGIVKWHWIRADVIIWHKLLYCYMKLFNIVLIYSSNIFMYILDLKNSLNRIEGNKSNNWLWGACTFTRKFDIFLWIINNQKSRNNFLLNLPLTPLTSLKTFSNFYWSSIFNRQCAKVNQEHQWN